MIIVDAPSFAPSGPWVQIIAATPDGTFEWPPKAYGWGSVLVKVKSKAAKDNQKAAGRGKAKTKKSGPAPLDVTLEFTFLRANFSDPRGACALLNALDPNNPNGEGGPFDFMAADFNRRLGKSIDVDDVGEIVWRGHIGTCTVTAKEWVPEPPKDATGTKTPGKSTEHTPGDEDPSVKGEGTVIIPRGDNVLEGRLDNTEASTRNQSTGVIARTVAARGFDGPEAPKVGP
jgi:hypothetical protein